MTDVLHISTYTDLRSSNPQHNFTLIINTSHILILSQYISNINTHPYIHVFNNHYYINTNINTNTNTNNN